MPTCRKCKTIFGVKVVIQGRERSLSNRKFCLVCSPFGQHNTRADDPAKSAMRDKKIWSKEARRRSTEQTCQRGRRRKEHLISRAGGRCSSCGYAKCLAALCFHHRDRNQKSFGLTVGNLWSKPIAVLEQEADKCDLLCLNCHAETHAAEHKERKV